MNQTQIKSIAKKHRALDQRDLKILYKVWLAATEDSFARSHGHTNKADALQKALDHAEDILGNVEEYPINIGWE